MVSLLCGLQDVPSLGSVDGEDSDSIERLRTVVASLQEQLQVGCCPATGSTPTLLIGMQLSRR